jgi:hypothetical protein
VVEKCNGNAHPHVLKNVMFTRLWALYFSKCPPARPSTLLAGIIMFWKCPPFVEERLCTIMLPPTTLKKIEHFFTHAVMLETMSINLPE